MRHHIRPIIALFLFAVTAELSALAPAVARGGAPNIMGSPGYQRALEESRKRYRESYSQPYTQPPAVYPRKKKWRKRGQRH